MAPALGRVAEMGAELDSEGGVEAEEQVVVNPMGRPAIQACWAAEEDGARKTFTGKTAGKGEV